MGILSWLVVGVLAGAVARWVTGARRRGCLATIAIGIVGAFIGGAVYRLATGESWAFDHLGLGSLLVALLGAVILLLVLEAVGSRSRR
jgi:uncharacterized membrane protein YeaQ/YmgE (transglycosylase-associated protein family)